MANILIVEDEKNMQGIIAEYMQRGGHTCFTADDGVDALMILKNNPMDLMMAGTVRYCHRLSHTGRTDCGHQRTVNKPDRCGNG